MADYRTFASPGGLMVNGVAYLLDPNLVVNGVTGNFRPAITSDFAANISVSGLSLTVGAVAVTGNPQVQISNTPTVTIGNPVLAVSGALTSTFDSSPIVSAQASGNSTLSTISTRLATIVPISGNVNASVTIGNVAVTGGAINIANTEPINVTGIVHTVVTGSVSSNTDLTPVVNALITGNNFLSGISGLLSSNLTDAAWVTGNVGINTPIAVTGNVATNATVTGFNTGIVVRTQEVATSSVTTLGISGTAPWTSMATPTVGTALNANTNRNTWFIQNIHTGQPLYVNLGASAASATQFNFILNPSTVQGWGGGSYSDSRYKGAVTVSGGAWNAWEM